MEGTFDRWKVDGGNDGSCDNETGSGRGTGKLWERRGTRVCCEKGAFDLVGVRERKGERRRGKGKESRRGRRIRETRK